MRAYDCQSKYTCEDEINKACEHISTRAFKPKSTHTSYHSIAFGFNQSHQSMYVPEHPTTYMFRSPCIYIYRRSSVFTCG